MIAAVSRDMIAIIARAARHSGLSRTLLTLAMAALISVGAPLKAPAETVAAPSCGEGVQEGAIVVLSSGVAFRLPPGSYRLRGGAHPPDVADLPPEGCPGNPIVTRGISFPILPPTPAEIAAGIPAAIPRRLTVYGHDGPVHAQGSFLHAFESFQRLGYHCEVIGDVLEACRSCSRPDLDGYSCRSESSNLYRTLPLSDMPSKYRALPGTYPEPDGMRFAVSCTWLNRLHRIPGYGRPCKVSYRLMDGVSLNY
ncbi:MAG: hypothetical protein AAF577_08470 [Pseudomonadota bacterium]